VGSKLFEMTTSRRYAIAFIAVGGAFAVANVLHFLRPLTCEDCFFPYGIPFTLYRDGGMAGGAGIVWRGVAADATIVIVSSVLVGRIWHMLFGNFQGSG